MKASICPQPISFDKNQQQNQCLTKEFYVLLILYMKHVIKVLIQYFIRLFDVRHIPPVMHLIILYPFTSQQNLKWRTSYSQPFRNEYIVFSQITI